MKSLLLLSSTVLTLIFAESAMAKKMSATDILNKVEKNLKSADEIATVSMEIKEKNGKSKTRKLIIKKKNVGEKQQVLVRLEKPSDIKGVGLLSVIEGSSEDQWLYLPTEKKSRRIISSKKKDSFLGSEFTYEDFSPSTYDRFKNKLIKVVKVKGREAYLIESKAKETGAPYKKILTWVGTKDYRILQSQYFDHKGKKLKVMTFNDYKKYGKKSWRAQKIEVRNVQNKRGTTLMLSELKLDTGLSDSEFSKRALENY